MVAVGPESGGRLWVGCARGRFSLLPWRWPGLGFGFLIRAFRLLRQPWLGRYSHIFLWHGTTIWEAASIWRRGNIAEYQNRGIIVDAMEVCQPATGATHRAGTMYRAPTDRSLAVANLGARHGVPDGHGNPMPLRPRQVRRAVEMAEAMVGRPYDWYQIIRIAAFELGVIHDDRLPKSRGLRKSLEKPICSEGVAMCYLAAGIDLPTSAGVPLWRFAPDHMDKLRRTRPDVVRLVGRLDSHRRDAENAERSG